MELCLPELQGDACGKAELQSAHTVSGGDQQQPCRMFPAQCLSRPADANRGRGGTRFPEHLRDLKAVSERGVRQAPLLVWSSSAAISIRCSGFCICGSSSQFTTTRRLPSDGCCASKTYSSTCSPSSLGKASGRILCREKGSRPELRRNLPASWFAKLYRSVAVFRPTWAKNRRRM